MDVWEKPEWRNNNHQQQKTLNEMDSHLWKLPMFIIDGIARFISLLFSTVWSGIQHAKAGDGRILEGK